MIKKLSLLLLAAVSLQSASARLTGLDDVENPDDFFKKKPKKAPVSPSKGMMGGKGKRELEDEAEIVSPDDFFKKKPKKAPVSPSKGMMGGKGKRDV
jgi:hypothetical protein